MYREISLTEASERLHELVDGVFGSREVVTIVEDEEPVAVLVDYEDYQRMRKTWDETRAVLDGLRERNADKDPDEVFKVVTEIVEEVRQERYDRRKATSSRHD